MASRESSGTWMSSALLQERVYEKIRTDPVLFVDSVLGFHTWSKQAEILESVRDHQRTAVRSCHGTGKTATAARVVLWFLAAYPQSRVITTAPTWAQVRDLLWTEIGRACLTAPTGLYPSPDIARLTIDTDWFAVGLSTNQPERFQGHHAEHLLLVVDEASGVDERIFEAAEGFLTGDHARVLLIGNPTQTSGQFYRCFHSERDLWSTIHISALDSPNLTGEDVPDTLSRNLVSVEWVDEKRRQWGEDSPMFQVRVLGNFPTNSDDQVISIGACENAQARSVEPEHRDEHVIACDVARYGSDETVIVHRHGNRARILETYNGKSLMETAGNIVNAIRELGVNTMPRVVVDDAGLGGGVTDRLVELGIRVEAFQGGATAHEPDLFPNRRSEAWFAFADRLADIDLDTDQQLAADLVAPRYTIDSQGRRVVESKDKTKTRLSRSPDRADAVLMAFAPAARTGFSYGPDIWS
jgi:phage terminase large subunit